MNETLTPQESLTYLDSIAQNASGTRLDHRRIENAVQTIRTALYQSSLPSPVGPTLNDETLPARKSARPPRKRNGK